jgi:uncharacterized protein (DUF302 family)
MRGSSLARRWCAGRIARSRDHSTLLRSPPRPSTIVTVKRVINKVSHATVAETVARLIAEVEAQGMKLFTTIDHSGEAYARGLELRDTKLVIFGSPQVGTPIMQAAPLAGLDLPLKVLVRADANRTCVSFTAPAELAARYQLSDQLAAGLVGIDALTDAVVGR